MGNMVNQMLNIARAFIIFIVLLAIAGCSKSAVEVEAMFGNDIPLGTSKANVVSYLDSHGIKHSANYKTEIYYDKTKEIVASMPRTSLNPLVKSEIYIKLKFSREDSLINISVEEINTGL